MKKRISFFAGASLCCASLLLCGCEGSIPFTAQTPDFDRAYCTSAQIKFGEMEASADITRNGKDDWEFSFTEPEQLMGITMTLADGELTASLGELSVTAELNSEYSTIPALIAQGLDALPNITAENISETDGILTMHTQLDGKNLTVTADKTGSLISMKVPYHQLAVYFEDMENTVITEETYAVTTG